MPEIQHDSLDISVVLPVFNEAGHLVQEVGRIRRALDASGKTFEVIVVDDGSTDGSGELAENIDGVRVMRFAINRGSGFARRYGSQAALGKVIVWTDVDMTYPNDRIPQLVDQLGHFDQIVGARTSEEGTVKLLRRPAKWFIRRLASYLTGARIPDLNSGFRAFRSDVGRQFLHLLPRGFSCVTTLTMAFLVNGYSIKYIPIEYSLRAGRSKFHWWKDTRRYLLQVLRMALTYEPLRVFGPMAVAVGVVGTGKLVFDLIDKDFRVGTNTLVVIGAAAVLGLLGMLADTLVQVNRERHDVIPATVGFDE